VPSRGGVFEISLDGASVYSKKATGKHIEHDDAMKLIRSAVAGGS
jgi:selT/selW/selH-like putative selenoprotein